jgi:hypothetical protein
VTFYSNRALSSCGNPTPASKYDVVYAISSDHGQSFTNYNLRTDCNQPLPLDLDYIFQQNTDPLWGPGESNGISVYNTTSRTYVWATYSGASALDTDSIKTVVFGSRVVVSNP